MDLRHDRFAPVLDGLRQVSEVDGFTGGQIGDAACDTQHAVKTSARPAQARGGGLEEIGRRYGEPAMLIQRFSGKV